MEAGKQQRVFMMFLQRALKKILSDKEIRKGYNKEIKESCEEYLDKVKKVNDESKGDESHILPEAGVLLADDYFKPFQLACRSRTPRIVSTSLDCLQKLIAYGQLTGSSNDPSNKNKKLIDTVIETICEAFHGVNTDPDVELQIIKALLTAVTSQNCEIHEMALITAIRCCYNINLFTRNQVNSATAKATLTQMLSVCFSQMEHHSAHTIKKPVEISKTTPENGEETLEKSNAVETSDKAITRDDNTTRDEPSTPTNERPGSVTVCDTVSEHGSSEGVNHIEDEVAEVYEFSRSIVSKVIDDAISNIESEGKMYTGDESIFNITQEIDDTGSTLDEVQSHGTGSDPHRESLKSESESHKSESESRKSENESRRSESEPRRSESESRKSESESRRSESESRRSESESRRSENESRGSEAGRRLSEAAEGGEEGNDKQPEDDNAKELNNANAINEAVRDNRLVNGGGEKKKNNKYDNIYMRDAYQVLRTLCRMTMQPLPEDPADPRSHEMRSKMLALQLLLSVMQNAGPVLKTHKTFAQLIKQLMCVALSKNGVSPDPGIFEISLSIFLILISNFKVHLKMEIEVFLRDIFLSILESPSSTFQHKWFVMRALAKICADPQIIVDIYLNYDCDMSLDNIFERLVNVVSRIAQGHLTEWGLTQHQENLLQYKGMECLVSILKCLVEWSKDMYKRPELPSNDKPEEEKQEEEVSLNRSGLLVRSGSMSSLASGLTDDPEEFENIKKQKSILEQGIEKFNLKPKKGILFLQERGLLGTSPGDVAKLFHTDERLSKTRIGEVLGDEAENCKEIMGAYVDQLDFSGLDFVKALRVFLAGFRLPGEAQKIDRLMLKFAQRYFEGNPQLDIFASADTCYVLAYSIIMLTTDLHNDQVRNKITKQGYIRMNAGINDNKDLPQEYLEAIYDEIATNEIKMKYDKAELQRVNQSRGADPAKKNAYSETMINLGRNALSMMEGACKKETIFTSASHASHVRPMLMLTWTPFLAVFSITLQDSNAEELVAMCLDGFRCAVRVSCIFNTGLVRSAYIQSLARFTMLNVNSGFSEIKPKNLETIKTLIAIAFTDCNYLEESWYDILKVISQLELAQLIGTGVKTKFLEKETMMDKKLVSTLQQTLGNSANQNVIVAVDRIFTGSPRLDGNAIVHFVTALCKVSQEELNNPVTARMFSLQKIVEISYYNMGRIRYEWSKIWHVIGDHFNRVGCSPNEEVAVFAVDSLRQLSMKFLEKGELPNFRFQKDFLRPFEHIMKNNDNSVIRDMVVRCIAQMVNSQAKNIRSGWNNIFSVFHIAAADRDQAIVELAFQTTASIFDQYFNAIGDSFQDAVKCLSEFACNAAFPDTSMEAIRFIRRCANYVADNPEHFTGDDDSNQEAVWVKGWFPVLFELSCIINRCKLDVRTRALTVMFEIMKTYGHGYKESWWKDLFQIVFRIFDHMKLTEQTPEQYKQQRKEWMTTTCNHALYAVIDVFTQHYATLAPLLPELLNLTQWCVKQDNEQLARSGMNCLEQLVIGTGHQFREDCWGLIIDTITQVYASTLPSELRNWKPSLDIVDQVSIHSDASSDYIDNTQISVSRQDRTLFQNLQIGCLVQTEIIQTIDNIIFFPANSAKEDAQIDPFEFQNEAQTEGMFGYLSTKQLFQIVECLFESHNFAKGFNMDIDQRNILWKYGFKGKTLPNLQKQETNSLLCLLRILYKIYCDDTRVDDWPKTEIYLHRLTVESFEYYIMLEDEKRRGSWSRIVALMLKKMMLLDNDRFTVLLAKCYDQICSIIAQNNTWELQLIISKFFQRAKNSLLHLDPGA